MVEKKHGCQAGFTEQVISSAASPPFSFQGNFTHSIDSKGRVSLPADFRHILSQISDDAVVLTNYISEGSRCLEGFPESAWKEFEAKLKSKSRFSAKLQRLENFYLARAARCPLDKSGRILIPEYLRRYASLTKEITFTASIHGFRIWDSRVWDLIFSNTEKDLMEDPELFAEVDI